MNETISDYNFGRSFLFLCGLGPGLCFPQIRASLLHGNANENLQRLSTQESVLSTLANKEKCCLCGSNGRSLMGLYRGKDEQGIISLNN